MTHLDQKEEHVIFVKNYYQVAANEENLDKRLKYSRIGTVCSYVQEKEYERVEAKHTVYYICARGLAQVTRGLTADNEIR